MGSLNVLQFPLSIIIPPNITFVPSISGAGTMDHLHLKYQGIRSEKQASSDDDVTPICSAKRQCRNQLLLNDTNVTDTVFPIFKKHVT
jgi:hypothetical protein